MFFCGFIPLLIKIKFESHDNIGSGPIYLPEVELHTSSAWISLESIDKDLAQDQLDQGLIGAAHTLKNIAPLFVMCDPQDIHVVPQVKAIHNEKPTIFFYDRYPGGIGLSEKIYENIEIIVDEAIMMIRRCSCEQGCPSCIGTDPTNQTAKDDCLKILQRISA